MHNALKALALIVLGLAACRADRTSIADRAGNTEPFAHLAEVHLGMTARDFMRVRASASPEPYTGYIDSLGDYRVEFHFPGSYSEDQVVGRRSTLQLARAVKNFPSDHAVSEAWLQKVNEISQAIESAPRCYAVVRGGRKGKRAEWDQRGAEISIEMAESRTLRSGGNLVPDPANLMVDVTRHGGVADQRTAVRGVTVTSEPCAVSRRSTPI